MSQKTQVVADETLTAPVMYREGDGVPIKVNLIGITSSLASPTMKFFKKDSTTDLSTTYFTGSMSVSGLDTIITKTPQNLKRGEYVLSISATIDGFVFVCATIPIFVKRAGEL